MLFGGQRRCHWPDAGRPRPLHLATDVETVRAVAYDTPIVGWRGAHINALRLWSARAPDPLRLDIFNTGDHLGAMSEQARAEAICKFLYPNDETRSRDANCGCGRNISSFRPRCRICSIATCTGQAARWLRCRATKAAVQLNDTHPSLAVAELMRLLVDNPRLWNGTRRGRSPLKTLSYTNHTLLPEALEVWPVDLFERTLPRHLQNYLSHQRSRTLIAPRPKRPLYLRRRSAPSVSIIDERAGRHIRMGYRAFVGAHRITAFRRCIPT